jgi:hypothetical protein
MKTKEGVVRREDLVWYKPKPLQICWLCFPRYKVVWEGDN